MNQRYKIFTWPVNQQYLLELAKGDFEIYIEETKDENFRRQLSNHTNIFETKLAEIKNLQLDCILFQDEKGYTTTQFEILSDEQQELPKVYLEHHPPKQHPTNAKHFVENEEVHLVHVNHYNAIMWDNNKVPVTVIENGVATDTTVFTGEKAKGAVVLENDADNRAAGTDIFLLVKEALPLDLLEIGKDGLTYQNLPEKLHSYRFLFCPDRYASPGFAVYQAMMLGMPVVGLATTALPAILSNEVSGFVNADLNYLISKMQDLLNDPQLAVQIGAAARQTALKFFSSTRFLSDWKQLLNLAVKAPIRTN